MDKRFDQSFLSNGEKKQQEILAFDLVRASVNLVVASILITMGTNLKLPLSTTYVTFMVTMGSSLSDRAWGRESAVYRITGVLTVVGGWFLTAFTAFTAAFLLALLIYAGGLVAIFGMIALSVFIMIRTHSIHKKREETVSDHTYFTKTNISTEKVIEKSSDTVTRIIINIAKLYSLASINFTKEKRKEMVSIKKQVKELNDETKMLKNNIHLTIRRMDEDEIESSHFYVQIIDYLRESTNCLHYIVNPMFNHVDNNHPMLTENQVSDFMNFNEKIAQYFNFALTIIKMDSFGHIDDMKKQRDNLINLINDLRIKQIKYLKKVGKGTKVSIAYLDILTESKNLLLFVNNVVEAYKEFVEHGKKN
jgi:Na+/phosphate symporter